MSWRNEFFKAAVRSILAVAVCCSALAFAFADESRVKGLLQEALKLYSEHQYVRALDLFKQVQSIDPSNATADEYIRNTKQRILEWELQGEEQPANTGATNWDSLTRPPAGETAANAKDIIAARRALVERMRNRSSNTDNIVQIKDTKGGLEIILFHDQLFLPGLQTLRDEALPILANVSQLIRNGGDRQVTVISAAHQQSGESFALHPGFALPAPDPDLPQLKADDTSLIFQDIEATRSFVLFTYLAQKSMGRAHGPINE